MIRGRVRKGVVVLNNPKSLADGTEVSVRPIKRKATASKGRTSKSTTRPALLKFAGKAKDLPADAARNLDHYLYGHPKR